LDFEVKETSGRFGQVNFFANWNARAANFPLTITTPLESGPMLLDRRRFT